MTGRGEIVCTSFPGGIRIDQAPETAAITLELLARSCEHSLTVHGDLVTVAEQVVYRVVGFAGCELLVNLVEDRRAMTPPGG